MVYRHTIDATSYVFENLRDLLAKATPPRSGDRLAAVRRPPGGDRSRKRGANDRGADRAGRHSLKTILA